MNKEKSTGRPLRHKFPPSAGFFIMGFSCVFGSSWLLLPQTWMAAGKSFWNVAAGFLLGILFISLLSLSYLQIFKLIPAGKGEITYTEAAFGKKWAGMIGWCSFLVNAILCAWQTIAISNILANLFPPLVNALPLYHINGSPVTLPQILTGLFIVSVSTAVNLRGIKSSLTLQAALLAVILLLITMTAVICLPHTHPEYFIQSTESLSLPGIISIISILPFSLAGWENIAKDSGNSPLTSTAKQRGQAMIGAIAAGGFLYLLLFTIQSALLPPSQFSGEGLPFIRGLDKVAGGKRLGQLLLLAAALNSLNVYNGMFYGASRSLQSLGSQGYFPSLFAREKGKNKVPFIAILFVAALSSIAPFFGQAAFAPLVNISALLYAILWGSTVLSNHVINRRQKTPQSLPQKIQSHAGVLIILLMLFGILLPQSPGSLKSPQEYLLLLLLIITGQALLHKK